MTHESRRRHDQIGFIFFACLSLSSCAGGRAVGERIAGIRIRRAACRRMHCRAAHARNELMRSALRKPLGRRDWQQAK
jgi:hypothetical protein